MKTWNNSMERLLFVLAITSLLSTLPAAAGADPREKPKTYGHFEALLPGP